MLIPPTVVVVLTCQFDAELVQEYEGLQQVSEGAGGEDLPADGQHAGQQGGAGLAVQGEHQPSHCAQQPAGTFK